MTRAERQALRERFGFACNSFKSDWWSPTATKWVLHPLRDQIALHLRELQDGALEALTEVGRFHLTLLHLNRTELIAHRLWYRRIAEDQERIRTLEEEVRWMAKRLDALERALRET